MPSYLTDKEVADMSIVDDQRPSVTVVQVAAAAASRPKVPSTLIKLASGWNHVTRVDGAIDNGGVGLQPEYGPNY
jgi:hypothetical protein